MGTRGCAMVAVKSKGTFIIILNIVAAFIAVQFLPAQQPAIQRSNSQTEQVAVPRVSETWSSTLVASVSGQKKHQTRFIGHYPGYLSAKKAANQRVTVRTSSPSQSTTPQTLSLAPQAPSASTVVFDGPSESDTPYIPPD